MFAARNYFQCPGYTNPTLGWQAVNSAITSTAQAKFGTASLYLSGSVNIGSNYIQLSSPASAGAGGTCMDFGSGNFTISFWLYFNSSAALARSYEILCNNTTGGIGIRLGPSYNQANSSGMNIFRRNTADYDNCSFSWSTGQWYWCVIQRSGTSTISFWINGAPQTRAGTTLGSTAVTARGTGQLYVGYAGGASTAVRDTYIDEVAYYKSALYTDGTTLALPQAPSVIGPTTTQLLHMDGANNGTTFTNDTGY